MDQRFWWATERTSSHYTTGHSTTLDHPHWQHALIVENKPVNDIPIPKNSREFPIGYIPWIFNQWISCLIINETCPMSTLIPLYPHHFITALTVINVNCSIGKLLDIESFNHYYSFKCNFPIYIILCSHHFQSLQICESIS